MPFYKDAQTVSWSLLASGHRYASCRLFTPYRSGLDAATDLLMPLVVPATIFAVAAFHFNLAVIDLTIAVVNIFREKKSALWPLGYSALNMVLTAGLTVLAAISPIVTLASLLIRPLASLACLAFKVDVPQLDDWERAGIDFEPSPRGLQGI